MVIGWTLLGTGLALWLMSGPIQNAYRRHAHRADPMAFTRLPLWVRCMNPIGLVCASVGTILLIGWMFTQVDAGTLTGATESLARSHPASRG